MEVLQHIIQSCHCQICCNSFVPLCSFWDREVSFEISGHQKFGPVGALSNSRKDTLNGRGIIGGEVASDNVPLLLPCHHLYSDDVGSELLQRLDRKLYLHVVKHCHSNTITDWCAHRDNAVAAQFAGVFTICKLRIFEDAKVQVGLGHPPQRRL